MPERDAPPHFDDEDDLVENENGKLVVAFSGVIITAQVL